jgi:hypothetical protein
MAKTATRGLATIGDAVLAATTPVPTTEPNPPEPAAESQTDRMIRMLTERQTQHADDIQHGRALPGMIEFALSDDGASIVETVNPIYADFGCPEYVVGSGKIYPNERIKGASSAETGAAVFTLRSGMQISWAIRTIIDPNVDDGAPYLQVSVPKALIVKKDQPAVTEPLNAFRDAVINGYFDWMDRNNIDPMSVAKQANGKVQPGRRKLIMRKPDGTAAGEKPAEPTK